jgi:DNA replication protein DnaC
MSYELMELSALKRQWILRNSNIPRRILGLEPSDVENHVGEFPRAIETWLTKVLAGENIRRIGGIGTTGVGLLFDGGPGIGKTTIAVVSAMEFVRRLPEDDGEAQRILAMKSTDYGTHARPIYYMTFPEFLSRKKSMIDADPETKRVMFHEMEGFHGRSSDDTLNVRILILDDLGKEYKGAGFNDASFDEILRSRYDRGLPTIITTNVSREKWAAQYGEAMGSFAYEAFKRVRIIGAEDLRRLPAEIPN